MSEVEEKIIELEQMMAHLEHYVEEMNGVVFEQSKQIKRLQKELLDLNYKYSQMSEGPAGNEKPPHY